MDADGAVDLPTGDGSKLTARVVARSADETSFVVGVKTAWLAAGAEASTYLNGPITQFFDAMARNWQGWEGELSWEDIEGRVRLVAASDRTGHAHLRVTIVGPNYRDRAEVTLTYEAGALERMSRRVATLFSQ